MENLECPRCGSALAKGAALCGACGTDVPENDGALPVQPTGPGRKKIHAILAVLLLLLGGATLLVITGLLPNPMKAGGSAAAIVNGEKITIAELDQKYDLYKKRSGKSGQPDSNTPEGKAAEADMRKQILNAMIQDKILTTEAARERITVPPQEIAERIGAVKKSLNLSDKDFDLFLKNHGMTPAAFEKRIEKDLLISRLVAKWTREKGLTRDAWMSELNSRAKVEVLIK